MPRRWARTSFGPTSGTPRSNGWRKGEPARRGRKSRSARTTSRAGCAASAASDRSASVGKREGRGQEPAVVYGQGGQKGMGLGVPSREAQRVRAQDESVRGVGAVHGRPRLLGRATVVALGQRHYRELPVHPGRQLSA